MANLRKLILWVGGLKEELHLNQTWECFMCYLKIIITLKKLISEYLRKLSEKLKNGIKISVG